MMRIYSGPNDPNNTCGSTEACKEILKFLNEIINTLNNYIKNNTNKVITDESGRKKDIEFILNALKSFNAADLEYNLSEKVLKTPNQSQYIPEFKELYLDKDAKQKFKKMTDDISTRVEKMKTGGFKKSELRDNIKNKLYDRLWEEPLKEQFGEGISRSKKPTENNYQLFKRMASEKNSYLIFRFFVSDEKQRPRFSPHPEENETLHDALENTIQTSFYPLTYINVELRSFNQKELDSYIHASKLREPRALKIDLPFKQLEKLFNSNEKGEAKYAIVAPHIKQLIVYDGTDNKGKTITNIELIGGKLTNVIDPNNNKMNKR